MPSVRRSDRAHPRARSAEDGAPSSATRPDRISDAYRQLRALIVWGQLAPGTRVVESDVAGRLAVSRTPVRSALHRLQQEGYIATIGRPSDQRLIIAPLTQDDARELFYIVGQLEGLAARFAAALAPRRRASLVKRLRLVNRELARASRQERPSALRIFDLDAAFHRAYVEAGAGARLLTLHDAIKPQTERYVRLYVSSLVDEIDRSVAEHAVIIDQIARGKRDGSQRAVERNWRNAADRLGSVIASLGERGRW